MKRFHVHVAVKDLEDSMRFYSAMFGAAPTVVKPDYAKWMLEDPRVNFAISQRDGALGVNHLGIQAEDDQELEGIHAMLRQADASIVAEKGIHCCYAQSDKYWITDPQGLAWESFHSLGSVPLYSGNAQPGTKACGTEQTSECCAPKADARVSAQTPKIAASGCC